MVLRMGEKSVHLYEVYWADILKEVTCGSFQMEEVQSFSWFPWFNSLCGNYPPGSYSFLKLACGGTFFRSLTFCSCSGITCRLIRANGLRSRRQATKATFRQRADADRAKGPGTWNNADSRR